MASPSHGTAKCSTCLSKEVNYLFSGLIGNGICCHLDDLIIVSKDLESHLHKLDLVFTKLEETGLKAKLSKRNFLKHFPTPQNVENVRSFLGPPGYNWTFVRNFASIASPLTRLLKKDVPFIWHDAQRQALKSMKHVLTHTPELTFPDYKQPFTMCVDAPFLGVGAVLMQASESQRPHVIAYASRVLNSAECKYSVTHLEALAVVWGFEHFRDIIYGCSITICTDHSAVTQLFSGKNIPSSLVRWYLTVMQFEPTSKYLPGKANTVADALSRNIPVTAVTQVSNLPLSELRTAWRQDTLWSRVTLEQLKRAVTDTVLLIHCQAAALPSSWTWKPSKSYLNLKKGLSRLP